MESLDIVQKIQTKLALLIVVTPNPNPITSIILSNMTKQNALKLFEDKKVRTVWDNEQEKWYVSIVDVIGVLTDSPNPQVYWRVLKKRLLAEGNQTVTNCNGLKMEAPDGKMRLTDVADVEQLFRLIQSIPSPLA